MKSISFAAKAAAMGALVVAAACGTSEGDKTAERTGEQREALVTMRGVNIQDVRSALLTLSSVSVTADGRDLPTRIDGRTVDFAAEGELVAARFMVPADAQSVQVTLSFDDYGGYELDQGQAGELDARGTRVQLNLPARDLAASGKAQVSLDVSRSLIDSGQEQRLLAPHFELAY